MSSSLVPSLTAAPRRGPDASGAFVEATRQPLYSAAGIKGGAALAQETTFFTYAKNGIVSGNGLGAISGAGVPVTATTLHTNLEQPNQLPQPKKFVATGVRLHMPAISFGTFNVPGLPDPSSGAAAQDAEFLEDWLLLYYSCSLHVRIGERIYYDHPLELAPSNAGFGGAASLAVDTGSAATIAQQDVELWHSVGQAFEMKAYPWLVEPGQTIRASLRCLFDTPPTLNDDHLVFLVLDGKFLREVS